MQGSLRFNDIEGNNDVRDGRWLQRLVTRNKFQWRAQSERANYALLPDTSSSLRCAYGAAKRGR